MSRIVLKGRTGLQSVSDTTNVATTVVSADGAVTPVTFTPPAASVTLASLATGITPSHVVKFAGKPTTVGGAAAEAFTVTGIAATDLPFAQIVDNGTSNVTILQAVCTTNTLTITFSANPGNDTIFTYQILRAAA